MKQIILITNTFPYLFGEQFLETEVKYYKLYPEIQFIIMPSHGSGKMREVDNNIFINNYLINIFTKKNIIFALLKMSCSKVLYKELNFKSISSVQMMKSIFLSTLKYHIYRDIFMEYFKNKAEYQNTTMYTYWNTEITYALQSLKAKYGFNVISRIHGSDIYQERRDIGYIPLKNQFTSNIDKIFTITNSANEYLHNAYGFSYDVLELNRLGVEDHNIATKISDDDTLHIVSCSSLIDIKQVHKIIFALEVIASEMLYVKFIWTHVGDGVLLEELMEVAHDKLFNLHNVRYNFMGHKENSQIFEFYRNTPIDLFINVSKSEGVPVSIMEAMSCCIPIVAPNIGGISDMIKHGESGYLLSSNCDIAEMVLFLKNIEFFKNKTTRDASYTIFLEKYSAKTNYSIFLNRIVNIATIKTIKSIED